MENLKTALVVGASGVIGRNLIAHLRSLPDWKVIGTSRKPLPGSVETIVVDLLDEADVATQFATLGHVTHVFYTAYQDKPTWAELVPPNMTMFRNVVETIEKVSPKLEHISFMQGYKVYGAHLGPFRTPAREDDPPIMLPEFMTEQRARGDIVFSDRLLEIGRNDPELWQEIRLFFRRKEFSTAMLVHAHQERSEK